MVTKKQEAISSLNDTKGSKKDVLLLLIEKSGRYHIGPAKRPNITHDNGFLSRFPSEEPTIGDRLAWAKWKAKLEGAELLRSDLTDATAAYSHFLSGSGADRSVNYERYIENDRNGRITLKSIIADAQKHVEIISLNREDFEVTSTSYSPGPSGGAQFPYPATENWQKTLGAHYVWVSAKVSLHLDAAKQVLFSMTVTLHIEDRYNFNPGQKDIATGIPDSENGRFEITGLAKQFTHFGTLHRVVDWRQGEIELSTRISK